MGEFLERLRAAHSQVSWPDLPSEAGDRLDRLAPASPLYARLLEQTPAWIAWLESPEHLHDELRFPGLVKAWREECSAANGPAAEPPGRGSPPHLRLLRRFRRKISLRIAYRDVNDLAPQSTCVRELTRLAEFCLRECFFAARDHWTRRLGEPWDEAAGRPARFCILALGKLGGGELNFSSDIDLVYVCEGEGNTRRDGTPTGNDNADCFHRLGESITQMLNQRDAEGFLFRADLRLRPGGAHAPLVPTAEAVENYYAATGQTWERMALLKARPVVGDLPLGAELLESLHSFRYPRHAPPSLLAEVAGMKQRTELEVVGADALERNVKSGRGGIREIEFIAQVMQLLHAGRFPFLQTHSTIEALRQLVRYRLLAAGDCTFLEEAYWFLRRVEHRVQMVDEQQTHELPADPGERTRIAASLGFANLAAFDAHLGSVRTRVRSLYSELFREAPPGADGADPWWSFFADGRAGATVGERLCSWFPGSTDASRDLQIFVRGSDAQPLLRDQVQRFAELVPALDRVLPQLADPRETLRRIAAFGERYGSRNQFLATCTQNPGFFDVLALLFDRSRFIHELLTQQPEIFDEVLRPEILRQRKDLAARLRELVDHAPREDEAFPKWLWLYVRAEQVRTAVGQLLEHLSDADVDAELSSLACAVVRGLARRVEGADELTLIALGKFGGRELTFGSDLDVVFLGGAARAHDHDGAVRAMRQALLPGPGRQPTYELDLRLRPHGDAGALVPDMAVFEDYFARSAQLWERQALTRARCFGGPQEQQDAWQAFVDRVVYGDPLSDTEAAELWRMRLRVQNERDVVEPRERAFKTAAGGLVDVEFALQLLQLRHGHDHPEVRQPNTRLGWQALAGTGLADPAAVAQLLDHHMHLKQVEWCLRRDANRAVSVIPDSPAERRALARWMGHPGWEDFWNQHRRCMTETRALVARLLEGVVPVATLESGR